MIKTYCLKKIIKNENISSQSVSSYPSGFPFVISGFPARHESEALFDAVAYSTLKLAGAFLIGPYKP